MSTVLRRVCQWMSEHKEGLGVAFGMLALVVLPLADLVWLPPGQYMGGESVGSDFSFAMLPWWQFVLDSLGRGELPLWNPYAASGLPFFANPQPAIFYPPVWLIGLLPPTRVVGVLLVLHLWLAGCGMVAWLRSEGASQRGAWFGAVVFAFSGYFLIRACAGQSDVVMTQTWLPWVLWACHRAMDRRRWWWAVLGGVPVGLSLLAGHTATFFYVGVVLAAYALYTTWADGHRTFPDFVKALLPVFCMGMVGFALAAVQLIPTFQFLGLSTRERATYGFASQYAWPPGYLLTLLVPNFFGDLVNTGYWGDGIYVELIFYVGVLPLILALVAGGRLRHRLTPWLLALAVAGLLLALGPFGVAHRLATTLIPLFRATRAPARAGFLFTFAVATLGGLLVTWLERRPTEALQGSHWKTAGWIVGTVAAVVVLTGFILFTLQRDSNPEVGRLWHAANYTALFLLFFLLAVALLAGWRKGRFTGAQGAVLAIGLVLLDLWSYGRPLFHAVQVPESGFWKHVAEVASDTEGRILPWGLNVFEQNLGIPLGLESVFSYDPMGIGRYKRFTTYVADPQARAYDLLRARYLVTGQEMSFPDDPASPRLIEERGGVWVYERPGAFPAAWLVHQVEVQEAEDALLARLNDPAFDPRRVALVERALPCPLGPAAEEETVWVVGRGNNTMTLAVTAAADGVLVLSEVAYPGWRAFVDGERVPVVRADYTLRAICVPAGTHRITFSFWPASLVVGATVTALAWLLVGWAAWRRRSGGERGCQDNDECAEVVASSTGAGNGGERGYQDNNGCAEVAARSTDAGNGGGV